MLALFLLVLVALVVLGSLLMLFSWVTATIPMSQMLTCPEVEGCAPQAPAPEEGQAPVNGGLRLDEPRMAP